MNQILQVKETDAKNKSKIIRKVISFLIISIIIIALGFGGYYIYENIVNGNIKLPTLINTQKDKSTIQLTQINRDELIINIQSKEGISKIVYNLNNENPQVIELSGETTIEKTINMPTGENVIYVSVIDINGKEIIKQETFIVEVSKPEINLAIVGNDIKITVTSEVELSEVKYKWNSEDEKKHNIYTYGNRNEFEKQLEIPIGQNTLTIVATDINGSKVEKTQKIKGVTKPTTTIKVEGKYLHFTVTGKENIEKVEFEFNGQKYLMNTETFGETKTVHYKVKMIKGKNTLTLTSTTQSGGIDTKTVEQEY